ncbi:Spo0B domain-containing protein [Allobacillus sp. GCM10007491]|uniref:Spo0B domain-containing protein n=1 Tax=Allobacillus saliphilus TaxID=2912308 RepID=A0A941CWF1_9BACI|nr:Spo0B domain-containing protein [Allobacillus saliphilus]MBR7553410.1 Spo0B domain-containing protein [Allobacillus saliphilus]
MDTESFLKIMKLYRHKLLNELQVIHGYQSMNMKEASIEKLNRFIGELNAERVLQSLDAPAYVSLILLWKIQHPEIRLQYQTIGKSQSLRNYDQEMCQDVQTVIDKVEKLAQEDTSLSIQLSYQPEIQIDYIVTNVEKDKQNDSENEEENDLQEIIFQYRYK